jgi:hypothetical protein
MRRRQKLNVAANRRNMAGDEKTQENAAQLSQTRTAGPQQMSVHLDKVLAELGRNVVQLRVTEEQFAALQNQNRQQVAALSTALQHANKALIEANDRSDHVECELRDLLQRCIMPVDGAATSSEDLQRRYDELAKKHGPGAPAPKPLLVEREQSSELDRMVEMPIAIRPEPLDH